MTPAELIEIYGADAARWPAEHRDAARTAIAADPALQRALANAAALDTLIETWVRRVPASADANAVSARIVRPAPRWPGFAAVGLIAATVAAFVLTVPATAPPTPSPSLAAAPAAAANAADDAAFASLFTPTPDEENVT